MLRPHGAAGRYEILTLHWLRVSRKAITERRGASVHGAYKRGPPDFVLGPLAPATCCRWRRCCGSCSGRTPPRFTIMIPEQRVFGVDGEFTAMQVVTSCIADYARSTVLRVRPQVVLSAVPIRLRQACQPRIARGVRLPASPNPGSSPCLPAAAS